MKTRRAFLFLFFLLVPPFVTVNFALAGEGSSDRVMIKIGDREPPPAVVNVAPGTTVLWKNTAENPVKVKFLSPGVTTTCKEPLGFGGDVFGIQESSRISGGEFASLCFLEPNDYRYRVESAGGAFEGMIHVALD